MFWWLWILLGGALTALELRVGGYFLVFFGVGALFTGLGSVLGFNLPAWGEWLVFALSSFVLLLFFRRRLMKALGEMRQ